MMRKKAKLLKPQKQLKEEMENGNYIIPILKQLNNKEKL